MKKLIASLMSIAAGLETAVFTYEQMAMAYEQAKTVPAPQTPEKRVGFATVPEGTYIHPPHPVINEKD
jgi:hypothetical protein